MAASLSAWADVRSAIGDLQNAVLWTDYFYVDSVDANQLAADAIKGMLKELDPHSIYLTLDEVKSMNEGLGGNFEGIGVRYQMENDTLLVINTVIGGPSEKVGIMAGDRIIAVNDTAIAGVKMSNKDIQSRLRGPKGTHVKVTVLREKEKINFNVKRDKIPVFSIDATYMVNEDVGYIKISRFAATTNEEFKEAMSKLEKQGMQHLIIDLQGNGGGYLESATQLASHFLNYGNMIVYTEGRREKRKEHYANLKNPFKGRLVVLIDEESASASEILTGAMQDWDRAVVVGRRSFGKGLVQRPIELPSGAMIRLTIAHYYTPSGRCIQKPFKKGASDAYKRDLNERYKRGEYLSADSIHQNDSLIYTTNGGRTVYGGGGIMPDIFVPLDTTRLTPTHRSLIAKGSVNRYVLDYFKANQKKLSKKYKTFPEYNAGFEVSQEMLDRLYAFGQEDSIKIDSTDLEKSQDLLKLQIKASLAADLYEQGTYNQIMNSRQNTFKAAVELITDPNRYNFYLNQGKKQE